MAYQRKSFWRTSILMMVLLLGITSGPAYAEIIEVSVPISATDFPVEIGTPEMNIVGISYSVAGTSSPALMACREYVEVFFDWQTIFTFYWRHYLSITVNSESCMAGAEWNIPEGEFSQESAGLWTAPECHDPQNSTSFAVSVYAGGFPYDEWCGSEEDPGRRTSLLEPGSLDFLGDIVLEFDVIFPVATENQEWGALKSLYR